MCIIHWFLGLLIKVLFDSGLGVHNTPNVIHRRFALKIWQESLATVTFLFILVGMSRLRVYLSGPMSGLPEYNYPAFFAAADHYRCNGWAVVNPAEIAGPDPLDWDQYMRQDIRWLMDCDCISMLAGWEQSKGARVELFNAVALKMPILDEQGAIYVDDVCIKAALVALLEELSFWKS